MTSQIPWAFAERGIPRTPQEQRGSQARSRRDDGRVLASPASKLTSSATAAVNSCCARELHPRNRVTGLRFSPTTWF
ncbi:MAG: hypothetical protein QF595_02785 [Dehalococcoidia bacterium]|nr:hypothetical protein [Dehalococcoidia bacterium]